MKHALTALAAGLSLAALSTSIATAEAAAAPTLHIENVIGQIDVVTGDYTEITVKGVKDANVTRRKNSVHIEGSAKLRNVQCDSSGSDLSIGTRKGGLSLFGRGSKGDMKPLSAYPHLQITAPRGVHIVLDDSLLIGTIGDVGSGDIDLAYCGDLTLSNVIGQLDLDVSGAGDVSAQSAEALDLEVSGSGDVSIGEVLGFADIDTNGAGDLDIERIGGGLVYDGSGASEFTAGFVSGDITIESSGASDIIIKDAAADNVSITASGASDISIGGSIQSAYVRASGAGNVEISRPAGELDTDKSGAGSIHIRG